MGVMVATPPPPLVHVLYAGQAVCDAGPPSAWPPGTRWVSIVGDDVEKATCVDCCKNAHRCSACGKVTTTRHIIAGSSQDRCPSCGAEERFELVVKVAAKAAAPAPRRANIGPVPPLRMRSSGRAKYDIQLPWINALRCLMPKLAAAKIEVWQPGMRAVDVDLMVGEVGMVSRVTPDTTSPPRQWLTLDGGLGGGQWYLAMHDGGQAVPDMTHRATYLLVLDLLEHVGVDGVRLLLDINGGIRIDIAELRSLCEDGSCWWSTDPNDGDGAFLGIAEAIRAALDGEREVDPDTEVDLVDAAATGEE